MNGEVNSKNETEDEKSSRRDDEATLDDAIELTGHGKFNHVVLFTSGLIVLNVSMESVGMSYVITAADCELRLTSEHKGLITAAIFIGIMTTSFLWGYLGDRFGRRAVMLPALFASAVVSIASSFSTNVWMLLTLRIFTGCLVSASSATVYAYLGEMHMSSRRASAIAWGSVFISLSFIFLPGLAWLIIPGKWSFQLGTFNVVPWRVFIWSWCTPALIASLILVALPESPRYLYSSKGSEAALPVLATMFSWNHGTSAQNYPVKRIISSNTADSFRNNGVAAALKYFSHLFRPPLLRCVFISHVSMFAVFMLSSGLYMWVPDILNTVLQNTGKNSMSTCDVIGNKFKTPKNSTEDVCETQVSVALFPISMATGAVFSAVYLAIGFLISRVGKKTLYCGLMGVGGLATLGAGLVPQTGAAMVLLVISLSTGCAASILAAIAVDVFPTCLRVTAMCTMYMLGRAGAAVGSYVLGMTLYTHCEIAFSVFGVFISASTLLMLLWPDPQQIRTKIEQRGLTY